MPQYRISDGAPLRGVGGFPMDDCCCDSSSCTAGGPCFPCCPHMSLTYTVTLSGLGGQFASENGAHTCTHQTSCTWRREWPVPIPGKNLHITKAGSGSSTIWVVTLNVSIVGSSSARIQWKKDLDVICVQNPDGGTYVKFVCYDDDAGVTCGASSGATCVVSAP